MGKFYTLKDFVHEQGLNMGEFKKLDEETQRKWRETHQRMLKEKLKERDENDKKHLFFTEFLPAKYVNPDTFDSLAEWKKDEWKKQFEEWLKQKRYLNSLKGKSQESIVYEECIGILMDCGVPFTSDGTPLGI